MHHCLRATSLLFKARPFVNPKLEMQKKQKNKNINPGNWLLHALFFNHSVFILRLQNTYAVIRADGCWRAKDCMAFIEVINNNH